MRWPYSFYRALGGALGASLLATLSLPVLAQSPVGPSEYGQIMIAEYEVPPEKIAEFAAFKTSAADPNESKLINAMLADTEDWVGPTQTLDPGTNPYTLVVTITGKAVADGDIRSLWQSGWMLDDGTKKLVPFPGLSKDRVKAGEAVSLVRQSPPSQFTERKSVSPVLALVSADNLEFESMKIQLWAGIGEASKGETSVAFYGLWVGLSMLALFWWFRRA